MKCNNCGNIIQDGSLFCPKCGTKISAADSENATVSLSAYADNPTVSMNSAAAGERMQDILYIKPGTVLHERYTVGQVLGSGGFGITYVGQDIILDNKVAIKEFFPNNLVTRNNTVSVNVECITSSEAFLNEKKKILKEARILAKFAKTPGVVAVHDYFEENNTAYIVMEYLEGGTLKDAVQKNGVMTADYAWSVLAPIMKVVSKLHSENVIHRDISPENIMFDDDMPKLLDFGAAREILGETGEGLSVILKHGYAPSEQYSRRGNQGPWTDVYSMCATIYYCITGRTPDSAFDRIQGFELEKPSELGAKISPVQEDALTRGLAVAPKDRIQSIDELSAAWNKDSEKAAAAAAVAAEAARKAAEEAARKEAEEKARREAAEAARKAADEAERKKAEEAARLAAIAATEAARKEAEEKAKREAAEAARKAAEEAERIKAEEEAARLSAVAAAEAARKEVEEEVKEAERTAASPVSYTDVSGTPSSETPKKKKKTGLIVGIILGVIVLAIAAAVFLTIKNKNSSSQEPDFVSLYGLFVYWTDKDKVYHVYEDCPSLGHSAELFYGTSEDAGKHRKKKLCTVCKDRLIEKISNEEPEVSYVTIPVITLNTGETYLLTEMVTALNVYNKGLSWSSDDPSVASVDGNGTVTAKKEGTSVITITTNGGSEMVLCRISVIDVLRYTLLSDGTYEVKADQDIIPFTNTYSVFTTYTYSGKISIPSTYNGKAVTSIGDYAFYGGFGSVLTEISIPNSITRIGEGAFFECTALTSITIPGSVESIGAGAFYRCSNLSSLTLSNGLKTIGANAFHMCTNLTSITIPDSVTMIENGPFIGCQNLTINVSSGNKNYRVSGNCLIEIASKTLLTGNNCSAIPSDGSVTKIAANAFNGCDKMTSIKIPDCVTMIEEGAFGYCPDLRIEVSADNPNYYVSGNCLIEIASKTLIAGNNNSVIPSDGSVTRIGKYALTGCIKIISIRIPTSVTAIDYWSFMGCNNLSDVYYAGSEEQWEKINIDTRNENLQNVTIHYNS